jgi:hypothetical protein
LCLTRVVFVDSCGIKILSWTRVVFVKERTY